MTDTQSPIEPYKVGDRVQIQLTNDTESPFEGTICRVAHVFVGEPGDEDETEEETDRPEREMASAAYRLEDVQTGATLPIVLRHRDVQPLESE